MSPRKATRERGCEAHPLPCMECPLQLGSGCPYCLPRARSRLPLMVSRKSVVFRKCSFSFTLPREHRGRLRPPEGHQSSPSKALYQNGYPATRPRPKEWQATDMGLTREAEGQFERSKKLSNCQWEPTQAWSREAYPAPDPRQLY